LVVNLFLDETDRMGTGDRSLTDDNFSFQRSSPNGTAKKTPCVSKMQQSIIYKYERKDVFEGITID
ncbi:MAG: hypothetical protein ABI999_13265, partial [Acidobacteriota bacterium]